jgi:hypothetical protein
MATLAELSVRAEELKNVRLAAWLSKRSGSWPNGWHQRFTVLSSNFLYIYGNTNVRAARRIVSLCNSAGSEMGALAWDGPLCYTSAQ